MAANTNIELRNQVIYSVYVRNHTEEGTFNAVVRDLDRIKALGTDIIWLMPIHPIGVEKKKGSLGCPYAISNYREVNPDYGTMDDFIHLVDEIHAREMKCIIDVVYNHTSPDSVLVTHNPEYFYRNEQGEFGNMAGDWGDVIDLDYSNRELWNYQIDTLKMWAEVVDGFRCDVAPKIPLDFWMEARRAVEEVRPGCIWLAETVHPGFVKYLRDRGLICHSDSEMYEAFDICYDYDIRDDFMAYVERKTPLSAYVKMMMLQESIYPRNYVKLRYLENHDTPRIAEFVKDSHQMNNYTAFLYFQKGTTLIYAGQEKENDRCPSLFEYDRVDWNTGRDLSYLMKKLYDIRKDKLFAEGVYNLNACDYLDALVAEYRMEDEKIVGIFSFDNKEGSVSVELEDGIYRNLLDDREINVVNGELDIISAPVIIKI